MPKEVYPDRERTPSEIANELQEIMFADTKNPDGKVQSYIGQVKVTLDALK